MSFQEILLSCLLKDVDPIRRVVISIEQQGELATLNDSRAQLTPNASAHVLAQLKSCYYQNGANAAKQYADSQGLIA